MSTRNRYDGFVSEVIQSNEKLEFVRLKPSVESLSHFTIPIYVTDILIDGMKVVVENSNNEKRFRQRISEPDGASYEVSLSLLELEEINKL